VVAICPWRQAEAQFQHRVVGPRPLQPLRTQARGAALLLQPGRFQPRAQRQRFRIRQCLVLERRGAGFAAQRAATPQRRGGMDVERRQASGQDVVERLRAEHAAAAVEHPHLAVQRAIPVPCRHARTQHAVEQLRTRRRQQVGALLAGDAAPAEHRQRVADVVAAAAEALLAEVVGHAARGDRPQASLDRVARAVDLAQHQHEAVAGQRAARELA